MPASRAVLPALIIGYPLTNVLNYLLLALVCIGEFAVRRRVLSKLEHEPFRDCLRGLTRSGLR